MPDGTDQKRDNAPASQAAGTPPAATPPSGSSSRGNLRFLIAAAVAAIAAISSRPGDSVATYSTIASVSAA